MRILKQSDSAKKLERGDHFETSVCCKISKNLKGGHFGDNKNSKKSLTEPKKIQSGDHIVSSGSVSYVKKGVHERGTLCTNLDAFPFAGPVV